MPRVLARYAALAALLSLPAAGISMDEPASNGVRVSLVGHVSVSAALVDGPNVWSLGDDGLVMAWRDGEPVAWTRAEGARFLAFEIDTILAVAPERAFRFSRNLDLEAEIPIDGAAPCDGAQSAWLWTSSPSVLLHASRDRVATFDGPVPLDAARCTVGESDSALAWEDGHGALARVTSGELLEGVWYGDAVPRARHAGSSWRLDRPDETEHGPGCALDPRPARCAAVPADVASRTLAPATRHLLGGATIERGVVLADRNGWTVVRAGDDQPSVTRHQGPVFALVALDEPYIVQCDEPRGGSPEVRVIVAATGEARASFEAEACPDRARAASGRIALDIAGREVLVALDDGAAAPVAESLSHPPLGITSAWSARCSGTEYNVVESRSARRYFGPSCAPLSLAPVLDRGGRRVGTAICTDDPPRTVLTALRPSGATLPDVRGTCDEALVADTETPTFGLESDRGGELQLEGARATVETPRGQVEILTTDHGAALVARGALWASDTLLPHIVWRRGEVVGWGRDARQSGAWGPGAINAVLASIR